MNGVDVNLASFKGKVLLINFWATWCGPCRVEIPYLIELQKQYANDLVVLGVSVDDTAEKLQAVRDRDEDQLSAARRQRPPGFSGRVRPVLGHSGDGVRRTATETSPRSIPASRRRSSSSTRSSCCCSMIRRMLKGFTHARLACGCRLTFREGVEGSPVTVVVEEKGAHCVMPLHVRDPSRVRLPRSASASDTFPPDRRRGVRGRRLTNRSKAFNF